MEVDLLISVHKRTCLHGINLSPVFRALEGSIPPIPHSQCLSHTDSDALFEYPRETDKG